MATKQIAEVIISDTGVAYHRANGQVEAVDWADLQTVIIEITNDGPFFPDVYWLLIGDHGGCLIPQGVEGEDVLADRLLEMPGFNHALFSDAMSSVSNQRFLCWQR